MVSVYMIFPWCLVKKHRDCISCTEQVCIKGDEEKLTRLKLQRDAAKVQLDKAEKGLKDGYYGADRWYEHQKKTLERTDELILLLESPEIEDGAVIRLRNDQEFSPLKREIAAKTSQPELSKAGPDKKEMRLLGGDLG